MYQVFTYYKIEQTLFPLALYIQRIQRRGIFFFIVKPETSLLSSILLVLLNYP